MDKKVLLMILDGWGISPDKNVSAIAQAKTPFVDSLYDKYPNATLRTDGLNVGLPEGQMGNSEVGHMNIGAGRIVYQDLAKINLAVKNNTLADEKEIRDAFDHAKKNNKNVHFIGLVSNGGVHSHVDHLKGLMDAAHSAGLDKQVYIHAFTDGRDVDPKSGKDFIADVILHGKKTHCQLASVIGRYFAMDRDKRWERVKKAYDLMVHGEGAAYTDPVKAMQDSYDNGVTDEFVEPIVVVDDNKEPVATIAAGDVVINFNFRTDRGRQISMALTQQDYHEQNMHKLDLYYVTMTNYDDTFKNVHVVYDKENISDTLGATLAAAGKTQIRIAETEKYPHVTFFFNGGREEPFEGEQRILCPSPKVATYDLQPEMSAFDIRDQIIPEIKKDDSADFICLNFANPDMVGHTGVMEAAVKACETVDACAKEVISAALESGYATIVIADHGNCDTMINPDGSPNTAHTTNLVPIILVDNDVKKVASGILGDIAPTVLKLMGVAKPEAMTQDALV
ncbi:2,3-bisphosphoglycerate-independent phosphoglycerate mutase [Robertkochia sediminum]|uniref:2,3-bisphosphoglycerate-independent phosphoglycerate mutase n=1 Tax=Robertkochia sediminum TaxID=2785326 RepID=UPI001933F700|nr:2,3-bisphosphoglycerate-independent phosphoglycerate mutase [Robertkochia sediminum]MBL7471683.1 2,3-bisphosphoglycerate-independent phosphoglycerate mutase [Robertkochia sediminum]